MNAGFNSRLGATSQFMEQGSSNFWCCYCITIVAFVGCDRLNNTQSKRKLEIEMQVAQSPSHSASGSVVQSREAAAIRTIDLKVDVSGFGNSNGTCRIAVYVGQSHFNDPDFAIAKESLNIIDSLSTWQVQIAIPEEASLDVDSTTGIAVSAYHDENENSRLDKNAFGIPTERYGFSKNPKRGYGPPRFSETTIDLLSIKQRGNSNETIKVPIQIK